MHKTTLILLYIAPIFALCSYLNIVSATTSDEMKYAKYNVYNSSHVCLVDNATTSCISTNVSSGVSLVHTDDYQYEIRDPNTLRIVVWSPPGVKVISDGMSEAIVASAVAIIVIAVAFMVKFLRNSD